jgi:hypothetical protein
MRAPTRGLAKALQSTYWGGGGGPALPPARSFAQLAACGVYKTTQDNTCGMCGICREGGGGVTQQSLPAPCATVGSRYTEVAADSRLTGHCSSSPSKLGFSYHCLLGRRSIAGGVFAALRPGRAGCCAAVLQDDVFYDPIKSFEAKVAMLKGALEAALMAIAIIPRGAKISYDTGVPATTCQSLRLLGWLPPQRTSFG